MVKLFAIKCCVNDKCGYVGNETNLSHSEFDVKHVSSLQNEPGVVLFFSRGRATAICDKILELINDHKPGLNELDVTVVSDIFDQHVADELMLKTWMFKNEQSNE